ncbi:hypothetical protein QZH41_005061 [Actinostola sp. cb2023]|nr:hypothetical protein QZH41_005061 [Actinostola sp. cb2023]
MAQCVSKVELHISCRGLLDKDTTSKSDPLAALLMQDKGGNWYEFARTERVKNNLNPDFSQAITVDYYFEMVQKLKLVVYDVDNASKKLDDDDDFLGEMECNLGQGEEKCEQRVYAEEIKGGNERVKLTLRATNLDKKVVKNNLNPNWKTIELPVHSLCSGDYDATIKKGLDFINPKKQHKKKYVNSGVLYVSLCEITQYHSFLDYVMGGCQINFTVGIDFTASNGDPRNAQSLHYMSPYEPNEYLKALTAVGEVCQDYDSNIY